MGDKNMKSTPVTYETSRFILRLLSELTLKKSKVRTMLLVVATGLLYVSAAQAGTLLGAEPGDNDTITINSNTLISNITNFGVDDVLTIPTGGVPVTMDSLIAGQWGTGTVNVLNGGKLVVSGTSLFGQYAPAIGTLVVDGAGSSFTSPSAIQLGLETMGYLYGTGRMSITDGGSVSVGSITGVTAGTVTGIASNSTLTVGVGSTLTVGGGTGTINNSGTINMVAGAGAASGTYTPISAGNWGNPDGTSTIQALGGVLNSNHTVTVNSAITTTAGTVASMDLFTNQRGIVTDPSTGKSVGIGFQATATSNPITFSAKAIGGSELSSLQSLIGTGNSVLSAWSLSTTGTTVSSTNPVYLSLTAGAGQSLASLIVYDYNGTSWSLLAPADLAYDGKYASFTALNLNDVAVVGAGDPTPTPVPAAVWLLGSGLFGLFGIKRKTTLAS